MRSHDLKLADQFRNIAPYYDDVMAVVPYKRWVQYLHRLFKRFGWRPRTVLDVATGTGTIALLLADEGFHVTGIDISEQMIVAARQRPQPQGVGEVRFLCQDATRLEFHEEFDMAVSLFDSLNYILSQKKLCDAFRGVFAALRPGGGFIFDLNSEYALEHNLFSQDNFWDTDAQVKHVWTARYNKRTRMATVDMRFFLPDGTTFREVHKERAHRHQDVIRFLIDAGFVFLDAFDAYTFLPAGQGSERIFYVARKPV